MMTSDSQQPRKIFWNPTVDRMIEVERMEREGPTLKNVGDNFRTLSIMAVMWIAVFAIYNAPRANWGTIAMATIWSVALTWYTLLSVLQSGVLAMEVLMTSPLRSFIASRPEWQQQVLVLLLAMVGLSFMGAAALIVITGFSQIPRTK
jgi:hypothetical protein